MRRILNRIGEPAEPPRISPARGPPAWDESPAEAIPDWEALAQPQPEYVFDRQVQPHCAAAERHPSMRRSP